MTNDPSSKSPPDVSKSPIAVVGVSCLFPGSLDETGFWRDILSGKDLITDVPPTHWLIDDYYDADPKARDKTYAQRGAFLPEVDFDPLAWGVPPNIVPATDTSQLLSLIVAQRVLDDATRGQFADLDRERVSVMLGVTSAQELLGSMVSRLQKPIWQKSLRDMGLPESEVQDACDRIASHYVEWQESTFPGVLGNVVAGRIANRLDLHGTNCVTDAACASTFSALSMGVGELRLGQADLVICGGVDTMNDIFMYMCFSKTPALSPSGDCRPFSDQADGTMLGEGIGMVALRRLDDAVRDGDPVYAVLRGVGTSSDGRAKSVYAPLPEGQARAVRRAYEQAGYSPRTVELVEAHGTGTMAGDAAEFEGLRQAFGEESDDKQWCAIGSVKSQIGHTKAAAGAAGLVKAVLALQHKTIPPTIKIDRPNPKMNIDESPFHLMTQARPWVRASDHPRRVGVSSFGFGGSNFHLAVEESSTRMAGRRRTSPTELVCVAADDAAGLARACRDLAASVGKLEGTLVFLAQQTQAAYDATRGARAAVVAKDEADLIAKLEQAATLADKGVAAKSPLVAVGFGAPKGEVAFVFPGQGSQYIGMGADLAMTHDEALGAWDLAASVTDAELHEVVFPKTAFDEASRAAQQARLQDTANAQPAIGLTSLSMLALTERIGLRPAMTAGHSYGELTALHAAGGMDAETFVKASVARGATMAEAAAQAGGGTMLAVSGTREQVEKLMGDDVVVANHNHPTQVVLSGSVPAIEAAEKALKDAGVRSTRLNVSTAFHSPIVAGAVEPFAEKLAGLAIETPTIPVYANATAARYEGDARKSLATALASPVHFVDQIRAMAKDGARTFVEVGPGTVLTGLIGRILQGEEHTAVSLDRKGRHGETTLQDALAVLVADGRPMELAALWEEFQAVDDPRTRTVPKLTLKLSGSNYDKPYPPQAGASSLPGPNPEREPEVRVVEKIVERIVEVPAPSPAPMQAPMQSAATQPGGGYDGVAAFLEAQRQTAEAHATFTRAMADTHAAFLQASQTAVFGMAQPHAMQAQAPQSAQPQAQQAQYAQSQYSQPQVQQAAPQADAPQAAAPQAAAPQAAAPQAAAPQAAAQAAAPQAAAPQSAPQAAAPQSAPTVDLKAILLGVVAEKTGYPAEMLGLEMDLEADLGVDSIKRVEILSGMKEQVPGLPEVDAAELSKMRTLGEIVGRYEPLLPKSSAAAASAPTPAASAPSNAAAPAADLTAILLGVVAEKTGYPAEMLGLEMDLEADLGVDSIKRVEILSGMKEQIPGLPEVDAAELSKMRTLGEIVARYEPLVPKSAAAASAPTPSASAPSSVAAPAVDLRAILLAIVAEKTGYPVDMLGLEMDLEADLGVDSIKRVEILSGMKEQVPGLPEVDAAELSKMRTLGEIVARYEPLLPKTNASAGAAAAAPSSAAPASAAPSSAAPAVDLRAILLGIVAEKTGYPAEMLGLEMDLEADLGVDSIKRVEILSGMKEQVPGLPEVDAAELSKMRTLGEIVARYEPLLPNAPGAPAAKVESKKEDAPVGRFAVNLVDAPASGFSMRGLAYAKKAQIVADDAGVADALAGRLRAHGLSVEVVRQVSADADAVFFLGGLRKVPDVATARNIQREAFNAAHTVAARMAEHGGIFVTVQDTGGAFALEGASRLGARAWLGGLPGLVKTAALEWPKAQVRAIDLARGQRAADALALALERELFAGGPELEVGLDPNGRRVTITTRATDVQPSKSPLSAGGVVVASGGARGVTASSLIALAAVTRCKLVLLGRSAVENESPSLRDAADDAAIKRVLMQEAAAAGEKPKPADIGRRAHKILASREIRSTLEAIEAAGGQARYDSVDVQDGAALDALLTEVREQWGPIAGVVHGAGVLADKRIEDKTQDDFDRVFDTKVLGLDALLRATASDPLEMICAFSSVAGRAGNVGQSDYAMANEVLNKVLGAEAARRAEAGRPIAAKAIGWGPWHGGMVTDALASHFEAQGVPLIPIEAGARAFVSELADATGIEVVIGASPDAWKGTSYASETRREIAVDVQSHPFLAGHRVRGDVVVPVVLVLEWFARAAALHRPDLRFVGVTDVQVLQGQKLEGFDEGHVTVYEVVARQVENGAGARITLELVRDGRACYRANARMTQGDPAVAPQAHAALAGLHPLVGHVYGDVLFHGEEFQVIRGVDGVGDAGAEATMIGARSMGWPDIDHGGWETDPALLDGGLQLALLWASDRLGGHSLPTSVGELMVHHRGLPHGPSRATLIARSASGDKGVCDVVFTDLSGAPIAELRGVVTHVLPGSRS